MLFINNEHIPLDDPSTSNPYAKEILKKFEQMKQDYNFPIRIKTRFGTRHNKTGAKEPYQSIVAPFEGDYVTPTGVKTRLRYSKSYPTKKASGRMDYVEGRGEVVERYMVIQDTEMDKAYYMLYVCPIVKKGMLKVENKQKEAAAELKALSKMAAINYMLNDEDSELYHDENRIRTIAAAFGVTKADDKKVSLDEVKLRLIKAITVGESGNDPLINIKAFKEAVKMPKDIKLRARIQQAIDRELLMFDMRKYRWNFIIDKMHKPIMDVNVSDFEIKEELLARHLLGNLDDKSLFDRLLGEDSNPSYTVEDIDKLDMGELRSMCQDRGIPIIGAGITKEVLRKNLKESLGLV